MKLLRVRIAAAWTPLQAYAWALRDERGELLQQGESAASAWPVHDSLEIVVAASHTRIIALPLPPLAPARIPAAARYAVEDEIAGGDAATHVATSAQHEGTVLAILCPRALLEPLRVPDRALGRLDRAIAEPELAAPAPAWRWCRSAASDSGFVRLPDGGAFAVSDVAAGALPPELIVALANTSAQKRPAVRVEWAANPADLARWQRDFGIDFVQAPPFDWREAATPQGVTDLLQGELALREEAPRPAMRRVWTPALWLLVIAAAVHVAATLGEWITLRTDAARAGNDWQSLTLAANLPRDALASSTTARAAIARRRDELLHMHHRFAPDDALPLLARASTAMAALPAGSVKRAVFDGGHWTIEVQGASAAALADVESRLRSAGVETLMVATDAGARIRWGEP